MDFLDLIIYKLIGHKSLNEDMTISEQIRGFFEKLQLTNIPEYVQVISDILHLGNSRKENLWYRYFREQLPHHAGNVTWIDFETEMSRLITSWNPDLITNQYPQDIAKTMGDPCFEFPNDLLETTNNAMTAHIRQDVCNKTSIFLYKELLKFAFCFELYLRFFVLEPQVKQDHFLQNLLSGHSPAIDKFILSFNYTDTETIYDTQVCSEVKIQHIHGIVRSSKDLSDHMSDEGFQLRTSLVLGCNSLLPGQELDRSPFLWFEKFYQRILHQTSTDIYNWLVQHNGRIHTVFYGHSLDRTDADLIKKIFAASERVKIYYHEPTSLPSLIVDLTQSLGKDLLETEYTGNKLTFVPSGS